MEPNQISYQQVCLLTGRLFLESRAEIERLTTMLMELQKKYSDENQNNLKLEAALANANQQISVLEKINGK